MKGLKSRFMVTGAVAAFLLQAPLSLCAMAENSAGPAQHCAMMQMQPSEAMASAHDCCPAQAEHEKSLKKIQSVSVCTCTLQSDEKAVAAAVASAFPSDIMAAPASLLFTVLLVKSLPRAEEVDAAPPIGHHLYLSHTSLLI